MEKYVYSGNSLAAGGCNELSYKEVWSSCPGQDGAIYGDYLFRFDAAGFCRVFSMTKQQEVSSFVLDRVEQLKPHSNAVCFGTEFVEEGDEFPLLYTNIYNNYAKAEDRLEGVCCVYRLTRQGDVFKTKLVQVIRIGFVNDLHYWKSCQDVRPYGNFVVDTDHDRLYAFTMRDAAQSTRYFAFDLPKAADGVFDAVYQANVVTLETEDIKDQFDCEYSRYIQGACYHDNKIFSVEGFSDTVNPGKMQIIDLLKKEQFAAVDLYGIGLNIEPEFVAFCGDTLHYSDATGRIFTFTFA